jgi:hypothetical protein
MVMKQQLNFSLSPSPPSSHWRRPPPMPHHCTVPTFAPPTLGHRRADLSPKHDGASLPGAARWLDTARHHEAAQMDVRDNG